MPACASAPGAGLCATDAAQLIGRKEGGGREEVHLLPLPLLNIMGGGAEHRIRQSTDQDVTRVMIHLPIIAIADTTRVVVEYTFSKKF